MPSTWLSAKANQRCFAVADLGATAFCDSTELLIGRRLMSQQSRAHNDSSARPTTRNKALSSRPRQGCGATVMRNAWSFTYASEDPCLLQIAYFEHLGKGFIVP
jgi:hypothetical protein